MLKPRSLAAWKRIRRRQSRRRDRRALPTTSQIATILTAIPSLPRSALAQLTQRMIDRMDEIDGDWDLEDDDPAGDPLDRGEAQAETAIIPFPPIYGIDQTLGPINEKQAYLTMRELERRG